MSDTTEEVVSAPPCNHVSWKINIPPTDTAPYSLVCVSCGTSLSSLPDYHPARTTVTLDALLDLCVMCVRTIDFLNNEITSIRFILEGRKDE